jgi:hypothetical protein
MEMLTKPGDVVQQFQVDGAVGQVEGEAQTGQDARSRARPPDFHADPEPLPWPKPYTCSCRLRSVGVSTKVPVTFRQCLSAGNDHTEGCKW